MRNLSVFYMSTLLSLFLSNSILILSNHIVWQGEMNDFLSIPSFSSLREKGRHERFETSKVSWYQAIINIDFETENYILKCILNRIRTIIIIK